MSFYIEFLLHHQEHSPLPHHFEMLLVTIAKFNQVNKIKMRCTDLIKLAIFGSPATIHKNYQLLVTNGYLYLERDTVDQRLKYIHLTPVGHQHIKNMEDVLKGLMAKSKKLAKGNPL